MVLHLRGLKCKSTLSLNVIGDIAKFLLYLPNCVEVCRAIEGVTSEQIYVNEAY